jgi:hypothetical protein
MKRRTVDASRRSCRSLASARRVMLRDSDSPAGFDRYAAFIQANADWPSITSLRRVDWEISPSNPAHNRISHKLDNPTPGPFAMAEPGFLLVRRAAGGAGCRPGNRQLLRRGKECRKSRPRLGLVSLIPSGAREWSNFFGQRLDSPAPCD